LTRYRTQAYTYQKIQYNKVVGDSSIISIEYSLDFSELRYLLTQRTESDASDKQKMKKNELLLRCVFSTTNAAADTAQQSLRRLDDKLMRLSPSS